MSKKATTKAGQPRLRAPGAGRPSGSFSFVAITLEQLKALTPPNPDFKWRVSRKQVEEMGGNHLLTGSVSELKEVTAGQSEESAPKVVEVEF